LFNYVRKTNASIIRLAQNLNIKTAVLDTEGAIFADIQDFVRGITASKIQNLDLYMTWGVIQKTSLETECPNLAKNIVVTGHPRFDRYLSYEPKSFNKEYVLINTAFPSLFPKYSSLTREFTSVQEIFNIDANSMAKNFQLLSISYGRFVESIINIINSLPHTNFLIRAHPFENDDRYKVFFSSYKNVKVDSTGDVSYALLKSSCLIAFNCTTTVEAYLLGVPTLSLELCDVGLPRSILPKILSKEVFSVSEAISFISNLQLEKSESLDCSSSKFDEHVYNYFGFLDGKSCDRISKAISEIINNGDLNRNVSREIPISFKDNLMRLLYGVFGVSIFYLVIKWRYFGKIDFRDKFFSFEDARDCIGDKVTIKRLKGFFCSLFGIPFILRLQAKGTGQSN